MVDGEARAQGGDGGGGSLWTDSKSKQSRQVIETTEKMVLGGIFSRSVSKRIMSG